MNNDAYWFFAGDTVCYCARHHAYLNTIARWPSIHIPREALTGEVTKVTRRTVTVRWSNNGEPVTHLPGNLELVRACGAASRFHEEEK